MNKAFPKLFEHGKIGQMELKNRILKAPQLTGLGARDGSVTERLLRHYRELALGGCALVIIEYTWVDKKASKSAACQLGVADSEHIPGLSLLAQTIQANGAKAALQISHCGRQKFLGTPPLKAASRVPWEELHEQGGAVPEELTFEEIQEIVCAFGDAARRAQVAGFDMVEIHGAHGYLITNFLSPRTNKRTDWYGGSLENRMRFLLEIVTGVRAKVGPGFPLGVRLSGTEYEPDGVIIEDTVEAAKALEKLGVDVIHVSGGNHHQVSHQISPMLVPVGYNVWAAEAIKKAVQIPVIASGSITTPELAEDILENGKADFISLGRPLLTDPYWPQKARKGRPEDIAPCIRCNDGCLHRSTRQFKAVDCTVNIALGKEGEFTIILGECHKKVAVIGGGPAGMEAARVAALRGHQVTIYDNHDRLGGRLIKVSEFLPDMARLIDYLSMQVRKLGVKIILKKEATVQVIQQQGFDAVILATGAKSLIPDIRGVDKDSVVTVDDVMNDKKLGQNVLMVGGGLVGCEVAFFLAIAGKLSGLSRFRRMLPQGVAKGVTELLLSGTKLPPALRKKIHIIEASDDIASGVERGAKQVIFEGFSRYGVEINLGLRLEEVLERGVVAIDRGGRRYNFEADSIVLTSFTARNDLLEQLEKANIEIYAVGDCVEPRRIYDAIHEGHIAARNL